MDYDPDRMQRLVEMQLPRKANKLQRFIHAINCMYAALLNLVETETILRNLLKGCLWRTSRNKSVATRRALSDKK